MARSKRAKISASPRRVRTPARSKRTKISASPNPFVIPFLDSHPIHIEQAKSLFDEYNLSSPLYVDLWNMYLIEKSQKGCMVLSSEPSAMKSTEMKASFFNSIVINLTLNMDETVTAKPPTMSSQHFNNRELNTFRSTLERCVTRNHRFIVPVVQNIAVFNGSRQVFVSGHQTAMVIDPKMKQIFYYDPNYTSGEHNETVTQPMMILLTSEIQTNECFRSVKDYHFVFPDLSETACSLSLQTKLQSVGLDKGYCQYYTLLSSLCYFENEGYTFNQTVAKLGELPPNKILFLILCLHDDFIKWIRRQYGNFYRENNKTVPVTPADFPELLRTPKSRVLATDPDWSDFSNFRNYLIGELTKYMLEQKQDGMTKSSRSGSRR